jgi:S1-C subfamily serine protease
LRRVALVAAAAAALAGCGSKGATTTTVVRTSNVEVVKPSPDQPSGTTSARPDMTSLYERDSPGVVTVISLDLGGASGAAGGGLGSGFVISGSGDILTNAHVVTSGIGARIKPAGGVYVKFADGNQVAAKIVGFDPNADVALLRIDPSGLTLRPLPLGSTRHVQVGSPVAAIGSPFGEEQSLSVGVVSATERSIDSLTGFKIEGAIQTDAAINHGNSGGPLLDTRGRVLGINSQIQSGSGDGVGVGFAVPIDTVKRSVAQLRASGRVRYAYLGIQTLEIYPQLAARFRLGATHGAYLDQVVKGGPADKAGLKGASGKAVRFQVTRFRPGGDVITKVDASTIRRAADVSRALARYLPGQTVSITVVRGGQVRVVRVKLGERPPDTRPTG